MTKLKKIAEIRPKALGLFNEVEGEKFIPRASEYDAAREVEGQKEYNLTRAEHSTNKEILKLRGQSYTCSLLLIESETVVHRTVIQCPWNRAAQYLPIGRAAVMTTDIGIPQLLERYTDYSLYVQYPDGEKAAPLLDAVIVKDVDGNFWWDVSGVFRNMLTHQEHHEPQKLLAEGLIYGAYADNVNLETMTAGQSKKLQIPFVAKKYGELQQKLKYLLTSGASVGLMSEEGEAVSPKDMAQANNRLSQPDAPATQMAVVECAAFYFGKIKNAAGDEYRDGFGFVNSDWWSKILTMHADYKKVFTPSSVEGMCLQARPAMWKAMAEVVNEDYLSDFIFRRNMEVTSFVQSAMTDKEVTAFMAGCKGKGELAGKLVVLCATPELKEQVDAGIYQAIQIFTDRNGNKAPFDPCMEILFNLLSISHSCRDIRHGANLSGQLLQTLFAANKKRTMQFVNHTYRKMVESKMTLLDEENIKTPSILDMLSDTTNMSQLLVQICPAVATKWYFPLLKSVTKNVLTGLNRDARDLSIETEGLYCKIVPDPAMDFGMNLLNIEAEGQMEVLCTGAERHGYTRGIGIKYPKCHTREYGKIKIVTVEEYVDRIKATNLLDYEKKILIEKVTHLSQGVIIIPAIELVKNQLAGLDFDGDALILYLSKELCDIVWSWHDGNPLAICIQEKDMTVKDEESIYGKVMRFLKKQA